uniref:CSON008856 protein n=1 Tax=Culicoides sonorensis TaxID=179676 RepID=A0A336JYU1_CULSO
MIDNPDDYIEEVYEANQFHGQDGEGRALFGYTDHNQARVEAINGMGDVRGSYKYIDPFGEEIEVKYWADSLGFHQTDNRPVVELTPVTETPEVRAAREAHLKAWEEAAAQAGISPDPQSDIYNRNAIARDEEISRREQEAELMRAAREEARLADPRINGRSTYEPEEQELQGPPRGFFYNFDYPVNLIIPRSQQRSLKGAASSIEAVTVKPDVRAPVIGENDDTIRVSAVHDTQVHPKQRV